jgi:hypothetical protein
VVLIKIDHPPFPRNKRPEVRKIEFGDPVIPTDPVAPELYPDPIQPNPLPEEEPVIPEPIIPEPRQCIRVLDGFLLESIDVTTVKDMASIHIWGPLKTPAFLHIGNMVTKFENFIVSSHVRCTDEDGNVEDYPPTSERIQIGPIESYNTTILGQLLKTEPTIGYSNTQGLMVGFFGQLKPLAVNQPNISFSTDHVNDPDFKPNIPAVGLTPHVIPINPALEKNEISDPVATPIVIKPELLVFKIDTGDPRSPMRNSVAALETAARTTLTNHIGSSQAERFVVEYLLPRQEALTVLRQMYDSTRNSVANQYLIGLISTIENDASVYFVEIKIGTNPNVTNATFQRGDY